MNLLNLEEKEINNVKKTLIENGMIFEKDKTAQYDAKFFETVTLSNTLIKFFLFLSLGVYVAINLTGLIFSIIYDPNFSIDIIGTLIGLFAICLIVSAIFSNINTNKKKEEFPLFISGENFIFNFTEGISQTTKLFYSLPYESVQKIEFIIHSIKKKQLYGSVTFTFKVLDYTVTHSLRYTNLTLIEELIESKFPTLLNVLFIDRKAKNEIKVIKNNKKLKNISLSLTLIIIAISLIVIPYILNFDCLALTISGITLIISAVMIFLSSYLYTNFLVQGIIVSNIFIILGFFMPLLIIKLSNLSTTYYIIQNPQILMVTIFGVIGLCLYAYSTKIFISKIHYMLNKKFHK